MRASRILVVLALALSLVVFGVPDISSSIWAHIDNPEVSWKVHGSVWESQEIRAPITMVALSWEEKAPDRAWFHVKRDGRWQAWMPLPLQDAHAPDPLTPERRRSKPASDVVWVGPSEAAQFRTTGEGSGEAQVVLIDTTDRTKPVSRRLGDVLAPRVPAAFGIPPQPFIHPRSEWDPSNSCQPKDDHDYGQITHAFVHHTTGTNSYTSADVPSRILGICLFHTQTRGWDDIGYNFLIDRFGQIWEGRVGGIELGVQGAHTAGFNSYSMGVAFIGDHRSSGPTQAAEDALVNLLAWKFSVHNVDPSSVATVVSKGSVLWEQGVPVALQPISGHRDAQVTTCPGEACYARIPSFRIRVDARWDQVPLSLYTSPLIGDFDQDGVDEAAIFRTTDGAWSVTQPSGATATWADFATARGWTSQIVGDFNGDGRDDIANFHPSNGTWWVSRSTGSSFTTTLWADFSTASGWTIQLAGDFNGDSKDDITNRHVGNGTWWTVLSTGQSFSAAKLWGTTATFDHLSHGWTQDVDDDGRTDVLVVDAYNGFLKRQLSYSTSFSIETLEDTPWRTSIGGVSGGERIGSSSWFFFGQEFQWIRVIGLNSQSSSSQVAVSLPRP